MILCWAAFIDLLGHMWPVGHGLDTPARDGATCPRLDSQQAAELRKVQPS